MMSHKVNARTTAPTPAGIARVSNTSPRVQHLAIANCIEGQNLQQTTELLAQSGQI
jgi:hypothetical protein